MTLRNSLRPAALGAAALALALAGCSKDGPTEPAGGALTVSLTTPNAGDGAVLLTVGGGQIDSVTAVRAADEIYHTGPTQGVGSVRVLVRGAIAAGPLVRVWVPDRGAVGSYYVLIEQAAAAGTYAQRAVSGYAATVTR